MPNRNYNHGDYRYGFNGKEDDKAISDGAQDFGARVYDNRLGRWFGADALYFKFPSLSPYNYCFNNPIVLTDPDGLSPEEPVILASSKDPKNQPLIEAAKNYPFKEGDLVFTVFAHGRRDGIQYFDNDSEEKKENEHIILTYNDFDKVMMERSQAYRDAKAAGKTIKVILISCETGKDKTNFPGEDAILNNIAKDISMGPNIESVAAPDGFVMFQKSVDVIDNKIVISEKAKILGVDYKKGNGGFNIFVKRVKISKIPFTVIPGGKKSPKVGTKINFKVNARYF